MAKSPQNLARRPRGSILVLVLFVLTVMSVLALSLAYRAGLEGRAARRRAVEAQLRAHARSAVAVATARLSENAAGSFDHFFQPWHTHRPLAVEAWVEEWTAAGPLGGPPAFAADYQTIDEEGKLHVRHASGDALARLGMTPGQIDGLFDWMDGDEEARPAGAESDYYLAARAYRSKNAPLESLDELLLIRGFGPGDYLGTDASHSREMPQGPIRAVTSAGGRPVLGWVDLLTCVGDGRLNINTAPWPVLATLPLSDGAAEQIIRFREFDARSTGRLDEHVFTSADEIDRLQGLKPSDCDVLKRVARFKSEHYRIFAQASHGPTGLQYRIEVLVRATPQGAQVMQWRIAP